MIFIHLNTKTSGYMYLFFDRIILMIGKYNTITFNKIE